MTTRNLRCACCGEDAGRFEQFFNQDTGWGLCAGCADYIVSKPRNGMTVDELTRCYGKAGINRPAAQCDEIASK
jgi:hypothetical protein